MRSPVNQKTLLERSAEQIIGQKVGPSKTIVGKGFLYGHKHDDDDVWGVEAA